MRYRIVRQTVDSWKVQWKFGWMWWWSDEGVPMPGGLTSPFYFGSEAKAEAYIDRQIANTLAAKDPPREYPHATS